jgi:exonuclease VII large subunit
MLARGWSLTYAGEVLVRSPDDVEDGDRIRTITAGGVVRSVVERENGDGDDRGK